MLRLADVADERAGGAQGLGRAALRLLAELGAQALSRALQVKAAAVRLGYAAELELQKLRHGAAGGRALAQHGLARGKAAQLVEDVPLGRAVEGGEAELAGAYVAERRSAALAVDVDGGDIVRAVVLEHGALRDGAGRDYAHDAALDEAFDGARVFKLFADGDFVALGDEPGDVCLAGVVRHAAHGRLLVLGFAAVAGGERELELARGSYGVLVEHLIEVAETEEQQAVLMLFLYFLVLLPHGCHVGHGSAS